MKIRKATNADAAHCVALVETRREEYQNYEPRFWKKSATSAASTLPWFEKLFSDERSVALRAGSGNLHSGDKWSFCLTSA